MSTVRRLAILLGIMLSTPALTAASDVRPGATGREGDAIVVAAEAAGEGAARTFGTLATVAHTINAHAFVPNDSSVSYTSADVTGSIRYLTSPGIWRANVDLPAGAVVVGLEIQGCDTSPSGALTAQLRASGVFIVGTEALEELGGGPFQPVGVSTGVAAVPKCGYFFAPLVPPFVINSSRRSYYVRVTQDTFDGSNRFQAVRLYYRLQVSPGPATPTFDDVDGNHPFFPFIEALVGAGITGGCNPSPPMFCPNAFVTRAQMAAFLSRALGLHFAP